MNPSQGRVALVTGGTRGIGRAISIALAAAGYRVAANYASNDAAAKDFEASTSLPCFRWDVTSQEHSVQGIQTVQEYFGAPIDILVNNAGITRDATLHRSSLDQWNDVIATNLTSCYILCRALVPLMRENGFGRIVNISSINAQIGQVGQTNYSAAKAGILGFTRALAKENASKGITVNAIAPGYVLTDMVAAVPAEILETIRQHIPVGRLGQPEDVARCVLFLVDDAAGFITGETLSVNGGHAML